MHKLSYSTFHFKRSAMKIEQLREKKRKIKKVNRHTSY